MSILVSPGDFDFACPGVAASTLGSVDTGGLFAAIDTPLYFGKGPCGISVGASEGLGAAEADFDAGTWDVPSFESRSIENTGIFCIGGRVGGDALKTPSDAASAFDGL